MGVCALLHVIVVLDCYYWYLAKLPIRNQFLLVKILKTGSTFVCTLAIRKVIFR
jgi:hypothetical protein